MLKSRLARKNRILLSMMMPVILIGLTVTALSVHFWTKPIILYIESRTEAELTLASGLGIADCEGRLNELVDLRLENNPEMLSAMRSEAIKEVIGISKKFQQVHMMIVENGDTVVAGSLPGFNTPPPSLLRKTSPVMQEVISGTPVRMHSRYFPFWRWHIVSFTLEQEHLGPILMARESFYLVSMSVLLLICATVFFIFNRMVNSPLQRIIKGAEGVAQGRYARLHMKRQDEIGQVAQAFDSMVESLEQDKNWINSIMSKLRESEERYRLLTENSLANVIMVQDGRFIFANRTTLATSGYSAEELYAMNVLDFVHPEDRELVREKMFRGPEDEYPAPDHYEFRYITRQGITRWFEILSVPTIYKGNAAIMGHAIDVTERKTAREEQRRLQKKLQQAQKMEALGTLVGAVAHDLNNIMAALIGYPDLLLMQIPPESPLRRYILAIQQSGQKAAAILQDLLTIVRRGVVIKEPLNVNAIVEDFMKSPELDTIRTFNPGVTIETGLKADLRNISGSRPHLLKALVNLVSNAAQASSNAGTIRICTENRHIEGESHGEETMPEGDYVILIVSDEGKGISREDLERIFEPFYTKKIMGRTGTGLGMAVVSSTVEDHRGRIRVESREGEGTRFELFFPASRAITSGSSEDKPALNDFRGTETILVVDDVAEQRELARELLGGLGYKMVLAASGEEAVEYFRKNGSADLLVLDMIMDPGIDGLETYKQILDLHPSQRAIIASGFSESFRVREARSLGAKTCIVKPYTLEKLANAVRKELDKTGKEDV